MSDINLDNLLATATNGKALTTFVKATVKQYANLAVRLHHTAAVTFFHVAQYGECSALNTFYNGLRVNDQTALRMWFAKHATYVDLDDGGKVKNWIAYNKEKGFHVVKGKEAHRKDIYTLADIIAWAPFLDKDVRDPKAFDFEAALLMIKKAAEQVAKKSETNGVTLTDKVRSLIVDMEKVVTEEAANLQRIKDMENAA